MTCDLKKGSARLFDLPRSGGAGKKLFSPKACSSRFKAVFRAIQVPPELLDALLAHMKSRARGRKSISS